MEETLMVGSYTVPFLLTFLLAVVFSFFTKKEDGQEVSTLSDRAKNAISLLAGIALGIAALILKWDAGGFEVGATAVFLFGLNGLIQGAAAVGLWKSFSIQSGKVQMAPSIAATPTPVKPAEPPVVIPIPPKLSKEGEVP